MLGGISPNGVIIDQMQEAIDMAKNELQKSKDFSKECKAKLGFAGALLLAKLSTDGDPKKMMEAMEECQKFDKTRDFFKSSPH